MERVVFKNQFRALLRRQAVLDEGEIAILVAAVKFVADNRMADVREVDADLMFASGKRKNPQQRKFSFATSKSSLNKKFCLRCRAVFADAIFHGDDAAFVLAERRVNRPLLRRDVAVDDGEIFFFDGAAFDDFSEFAGGLGIFCDEDNAAGLAVETVDQMRLCRISKMQPRAANQAGHLAVFGRMANKPGGFVDDEQAGIFVDDVEHKNF